MNEIKDPVVRKLFDLPDSMRFLPKDKRGYPVPRFVEWINGEPDFRIVKRGWFKNCVENNVCWLCGGKLGRRKWFVIGPMCAITHATTEPPSHRQCAEFAVKNCPFLTKPMAKRNDKDMPDHQPMVGTPIMRNPGVVCVWETLSYQVQRVDHGYMIFVGPAEEATFWHEGRLATRPEVEASVGGGMPALVDSALAQDLQMGLMAQGPARTELLKSVKYFGLLLDQVYKPEPANENESDPPVGA